MKKAALPNSEVGILVKKGTILENVVVYPQVRKKGDYTDFMPYLTTYRAPDSLYSFQLFYVNKEEIRPEDLDVFRNNKFYHRDTDWFSVIYENGDGIMFKEGEEYSGKLDVWGRIN